MARTLWPTAAKLVALLDHLKDENGLFHIPDTVSSDALLSLALEIGGDDLQFFEASDMLVWEVARHEGYIIPDYPLDSNSEARKFFAEHKVDDVPSWYMARGVRKEQTEHFWRYSAFMARNRLFWRRVILFPRSDMESPNKLANSVSAALSFCLTSTTGADDSTLFSI